MNPHVERFRELIARYLGLQLDDGKLGVLAELLERRARVSAQGPIAYLASLGSPAPGELDALAEELTVGETYFFRNPDQFAAFSNVVVPSRLRERVSPRNLKFLSAACASGEEPYSIAITLRAIVPDAARDVTIRAVDINPAALRRARAARYTSWSLRETSPEIQRTWFRVDGREHVLDERVRGAVQFEQRNLTTDDPELWQPAAYDAIFCRNVLMYFSPTTAQQVVARIERSLVPGGYLFLGHAETLRGVSQGFHLCHTHGTFYYQRHGDARVAPSVENTRSRPAPSPLPVAVLADIVDHADGWVDVIQRASSRIRELAQPPLDPGAAPPDQRQPGRELGHVLEMLREERFDDALGSLDGLPNEAANDVDVLLLRSVVLTHTGRYADAEATCRRLLAVDELDAGAHYVMALCREGAGDRDRAAEHDQIAAYLDPLFAMPRFHLGLMARRAGDRGGAQRELAQALLLFQREDAARLLLFGGGFQREALISLCRAELAAVGGQG